MDLMADQRMRTVTAADGRQVPHDPRQHRAQVVRRLLATGISAGTLTAIVPEWHGLITALEAERCEATATVLRVG